VSRRGNRRAAGRSGRPNPAPGPQRNSVNRRRPDARPPQAVEKAPEDQSELSQAGCDKSHERLGRPWRIRTNSEESRPTKLIELGGELFRIADEARGSDDEVKHVKILLINPLLHIFWGGVVMGLSTLALVGTSIYLMSNGHIDTKILIEHIRLLLTVFGTGSATIGVAVTYRKVRKRRRSKTGNKVASSDTGTASAA
jgi:hypothetical protein